VLKKTRVFSWLFALFCLLAFCRPAAAQLVFQGAEQNINVNSGVAVIAQNVPANNFINGFNTFLMSASPNTIAQIYLTNETSTTCGFTVYVGATAQAQATSFNNAPQIWNVVLNGVAGSSYASSTAFTLGTLRTLAILSQPVLGNRVVVQIVPQSSCSSTNIDAQVVFAAVSQVGNSVQGVGASGTTAAAINPVVVAGVTNSGVLENLKVTTNGEIEQATSSISVNNNNQSNVAFVNPSGALVLPSFVQLLWSGTAYDSQFYCTQHVSITALAASTLQMIAGVGGQRIRICNATVSNLGATATNISFVEGTGTNCGTGQTTDVAPFSVAATPQTLFLAFGNEGPIYTTTNGDAFCAVGSAAGSVNITVMYAQY
jgi:hypothetical protein